MHVSTACTVHGSKVNSTKLIYRKHEWLTEQQQKYNISTITNGALLVIISTITEASLTPSFLLLLVLSLTLVILAGKCCDEAETAHTECGHQGVVRGQLQKTEPPDQLTGIASLTEDQSDASTWLLPSNYNQGLCLHIPDCRLSSDGRNRGLPARP